jgi:hypothetical protein
LEHATKFKRKNAEEAIFALNLGNKINQKELKYFQNEKVKHIRWLELINPFDPGCHLVDDIQNAKEIFCVLSFKFNMFITRDSLHNSRFLSFFTYSDNEAKFQTQLT